MTDYPKYQYSVFLKGTKDEQLVIRADTWEEFIELKKKSDVIISKVEIKPAYQPKDVMAGQKCPKCGAKMTGPSAKGNYYCSAKCWLK